MFTTEQVFEDALRGDDGEAARRRKEEEIQRVKAAEILGAIHAPFVSEYLLPMLRGLIDRANVVIDDPRSTPDAVNVARGMRRTAVVMYRWIRDMESSAQGALRGEEREEEPCWIP